MQKDYTAGDAVSNDVLPLASSVGVFSGPSVPAPLAGAGSVGPFTLDCVKPVEASETATPTSNTGSPYTTALIDWLSFTFSNPFPVADVLDMLAPYIAPGTDAEEAADRSAWVALDYGLNGYKAGYRRGNISIYYDGSAGMGVNVQISGQGCRQLEAEQNFKDEAGWRWFLGLLSSKGATFRRVDVAMDDAGEEPCLSMETIHQAVADQTVVSLFRDSDTVCKQRLGRRKKGEALMQGDTRYFGSRKNSNMFVRIYNKHLEQLQKLGFSASENGSPMHWIRCEMSASAVNAEKLVQAYLQEGFQAVASTLLRYLDFKTPSETDTNESRWATAPWWSKFLGTQVKRSLGVAPVVQTMENRVAWLYKQVAPTLGMFFDAVLGDVEKLVDICKQGRKRYKPVHRAMLAAHLAEFGAGGGSSGCWYAPGASEGVLAL